MSVLRSLFGTDAVILRERNFQLLLLATVPPVLGAALLSPVLDSLIEPFGASAASIGLMVSVFTAPGIVMLPIAGALADRYGRKTILVSSLVAFGLAGSAIAFTTDFRIALGLRLVQGLGFGGVMPIITTSIGDIYIDSRESAAQGLRVTATGLSATIFPLFAGLTVAIAWQYPFLLYAIALPIAVLTYLWFDEPATADAAPAFDGSMPYRRALLGQVRRRRVSAMMIARALPPFVWVGFITYNSIIVVRLMGGTPFEAGVLVAVGSLVFAIAASQAGRITEVFDTRYRPLVVANGCLAGGFVLVLFAPSVAVATIGISITGVGVGVLIPLYRSIITGLAPDELRAGIVSLTEAGGRVTGTLTPIAMGGVIAIATPKIGFPSAIQLAGLGVAVVGGGGGLLCILVAIISSPPLTEHPEPIND